MHNIAKKKKLESHIIISTRSDTRKLYEHCMIYLLNIL